MPNRAPSRVRRLCAVLACATLLPGQEMATRELEAPANFRSKVNLVMVPVIVRDKKGAPIGNLKKEDFDLFDKNKLQVIEKFSIEKAGSRHVEFEKEPEPPQPGVTPPENDPITVAERYTVYVFDDLHIALSDLMQVRTAAEKHLATALLPTERVAVYTTSGRTTLPLTDDREKIIATMRSIFPTGGSTLGRRGCPPMSYFMADLIVNRNDAMALQAAVADTMACAALDPTMQQQAESMARGAAQIVLPAGDADMRLAFINLRSLIHLLATMPGQRNLVMISPGFMVNDTHTEITDLIDLAIRSRVIINSLDARGLHLVGVLPDISEQTYNVQSSMLRQSYDRQDAMAGTMLLGELADGTGGAFFQNSNDLTGGFQKLTTTPEYTYILGFSPQNLKLDGSFHPLKVKLKNGAQLTIQARRGYYAPKHLANPEEEAKREIQEALFSREVMRDLPIELHTQYFKSDQYLAKLGVLARVDLAQLRFKKEDGRNLNNLTVVAALFDRNGNFIKGSSKVVEMKLKDETLQNKARSIITIKTNFDVEIGGYVIRLVVRDSEGQLMAAQNGSVIIP